MNVELSHSLVATYSTLVRRLDHVYIDPLTFLLQTAASRMDRFEAGRNQIQVYSAMYLNLDYTFFVIHILFLETSFHRFVNTINKTVYKVTFEYITDKHLNHKPISLPGSRETKTIRVSC